MAVLVAPTASRLLPSVPTPPAPAPPPPVAPVYTFADPKFIGKSYVLESTEMYIRRESFQLEFFC